MKIASTQSEPALDDRETRVYDTVGAEMDVADDPPEGLIFHWVGQVDGK